MGQTFDDFLKDNEKKSLLRFSTAGSVDDGKSTLIGRLLYDCKNIFEDTLAAIKKTSSSTFDQGEIDFSLLTDGLKAEREQKITIDVAYRYFSTPKRNFILADTPGHEQYTRNMATGASTSNVALILIDARKGVLTQTKRHSFIVSLLGVKHILVAINKMDLVDYSEERYNSIKEEYIQFAKKLNIHDFSFVPVSALCGDNIVSTSDKTPWYKGQTVLDYLENVYVEGDLNLIDFRFPIQYVIRPDLNFRGYAGQLLSGKVKKGDEVLVLPSKKKSKVKEIKFFDGDVSEVVAPFCPVITLEDEIDISRGDMLVHPNNIPKIESSLEAMIVWMDEAPMKESERYLIKHTSRTVMGSIEQLRYQVDVNSLKKEDSKNLLLNEIGRVHIQLAQPIYHDTYDRNRLTGSFVLIDRLTNRSVGAGMILERQTEDDIVIPDNLNNITREIGKVCKEDKEKSGGHKAMTLWLTGLSASGKTTIAKELELKLFIEGHNVVHLDGDNLRFGLCKGLGFSRDDRRENIRRVAEVAKLFNEQGFIVITSFISPSLEIRENARNIIGEGSFQEVFIDTPLKVCEKRDPKGLYKKARSGEIKKFTGISSPYENPSNPELVIDTEKLSVEESVKKIAELLLRSII